MSETNTDNRRFQRVAMDSRVKLQFSDQHMLASVADISLNGLLVNIENDSLHPGDTGIAEIHLTESDDFVIQMQVAVAHKEAQSIGFHCTAIDLDSVSRLRRLVELNVGDAGLLDRELAQLVKSD